MSPRASAPLTPIDRWQFDYSDLDYCMAQMDQAIRQTKRILHSLAGPTLEPAPLDRQCGLGISTANARRRRHKDEQMDDNV